MHMFHVALVSLAERWVIHMTNQSTMDKLIEMRLTTMEDALRNQLDDPKF